MNQTTGSVKVSGVEVRIERLIALAAYADLAPDINFAKSVVGAASGPKRGEGGDIYDLRPFQDGDDPRHIDPAASARSGRVQLRSHHEQVDRTAFLVADFRAPMLWGTRGRLRSVAAAEALAMEGWRIVAGGGQVGCICYWDGGVETRAPKSRETAMLGVAEVMARVHSQAFEALTEGPDQRRASKATLSEVLDRVTGLARPGTDVILATGFDAPGNDFEAIATTLLRKCRLSVLLVQDALEVTPPDGSFSARVDGRVRYGRLGRTTSGEVLSGLGVQVRPVDASMKIELGQTA